MRTDRAVTAVTRISSDQVAIRPSVDKLKTLPSLAVGKYAFNVSEY